MHNIKISLARAWFTAFCGGLFYSYQYVLRVSPNMMTHELMQAFSIDATELGFIISCYYYAYASAQIPLGIAMDKFGPKKLLTIATLMCAIACYAFSIATNAYYAAFTRLLIGLGSACGFLGALKLGTLWFPPSYLGRVIALTMVMGTLGATLGGAPLEYMINSYGWRTALQILALFGILIAAIIECFVEKDVEVSSDAFSAQHSSLHTLKAIVLNPQSWIIGLFGMLMYVPITVMGDLWGISFISTKYGISETVAASFIATMFVGVAVGSPFMTYLSEFSHTRRLPMIIGAISTACLYMVIVSFVQLPFPLLYAAFFAAGFLFNGQCLCFAAASESAPRAASGAAIGFTNMIVMASGVVAHPIVGKLMDINYASTEPGVSPIYQTHHYETALLFVPVCLMCAIFLMLIMKETYPKHGS